jgi:hypothetical protein
MPLVMEDKSENLHNPTGKFERMIGYTTVNKENRWSPAQITQISHPIKPFFPFICVC